MAHFNSAQTDSFYYTVCIWRRRPLLHHVILSYLLWLSKPILATGSHSKVYQPCVSFPNHTLLWEKQVKGWPGAIVFAWLVSTAMHFHSSKDQMIGRFNSAQTDGGREAIRRTWLVPVQSTLQCFSGLSAGSCINGSLLNKVKVWRPFINVLASGQSKHQQKLL